MRTAQIIVCLLFAAFVVFLMEYMASSSEDEAVAPMQSIVRDVANAERQGVMVRPVQQNAGVR